jgi:hypothetical protein
VVQELALSKSATVLCVSSSASWDWTAIKVTDPLLRLGAFKDGLAFKASLESSSSPVFSSDHSRLGLEGYIVDSISAGSLTLSNNEPPDIHGNFISVTKRQAQSFLTEQLVFHSVDCVTQLRSAKTYHGQDPMDVYWITLRSGHYPEGLVKTREAFHTWDKPCTHYVRHGSTDISCCFTSSLASPSWRP